MKRYRIIFLAFILVLTFSTHAVAESSDSSSTDSVETLQTENQDREVVDELITIVSTGDYDRDEANQMIARIHRIHDNLLQGLIDDGVTMYLVNFPITELEEFSSLAGEVPRGWENTGLTWDDVPGAGGNPSVARIGYSEQGSGHGTINLELHEIAHSIDAFVLDSISNTSEFQEILAEEQPTFLPDAYFEYPNEYFAEAFAYYYLNEGSRAELQGKAPRTYQLISRLDGSIDKIKLANTIAEAQAMDETLVTPELEEALGHAMTINESSDATQQAVDEAAAALRTAIDEAAPEPADKSALHTVITEAYTIEEAYITSELEEALAHALSVRNNPAAIQEDVDEAVALLQTAIENTDQEPVRKNELNQVILEAENMDEDQITTELIEALENAITIYNNSAAPQIQVDTAVAMLRAAIDNATATSAPVIKEELTQAIEEANALDEELITTELEEALANATKMNNNPKATQEQIDEATALLLAAITAAEESATPKEDEELDEESDTEEEATVERTEETEEKEETMIGSSQNGSKLPDTATNMYNYLFIGAVLFISGIVLSRSRQLIAK